MEESLRAWIELVCRDILNIEDADCNLFEENLFSVATHVLQSPNSTFEELHQKGARILNLREDDTSLLATATIILKYAVSSECAHKSEFVSHIISMDGDLQEQLMLAIQDQSLVISDECDSDQSFDNDVSLMEEEQSCADVVESPRRPCSADPPSCDNCHKIEKELNNHTKQINDLLKREKDLEERLKVENTAFLTKSMDLHDVIREIDAQLQDRTAHLQKSEQREAELLAKVQDFNVLADTVSNLQDEVDVLRPLVKRAESAESQLARMHEKLDKLDGVKDQLRAEVEAHNTTQAELLELQVEIDSLRRAKGQVAEYRDRCAENAITIGDLTSQLCCREEEVQQLTLKIKQLTEGHQVTESYSKSLADELRVAAEALRESERDCGIGGGISELNPAVAKELGRLRVENAELASKLDLTALESLDRLQQDLSDQQCINTSLQQKWTKSKETIECLTSTIAELEARVCSWAGEHASLTLLHEQAMRNAEREKEAAAAQFESKLTHAALRLEHSQSVLARGQRAVVTELQEEYNAAFAALYKSESDLTATTRLKSGLQEDLALKEEALDRECKKRKRVEDEFCQEKEMLLTSFEKEKSAIAEAQATSEQELKHRYKLKLDTERGKNVNLAADIEEEKLKRRKLDREKRFHESECHRYKSQLQMQANSGDSNGEVESALKEMRAMQEQLDAAEAQVALLQSRAVVGDTEASSCDVKKTSGNIAVARRTLGSSAQRVNQRGDNLSSYVEQTEMYERKIDLMTRERREMIAKNLEENKERMELNQKLLQCEKETASYRSKVTKLTLETERLARRLAKQADQENAIPSSTQVPLL